LFIFKKIYELILFLFLLKITSIIIFLGAVINVLYYLGVMQYIIGKIAWLMQKCLSTTAAEVYLDWFLFSDKDLRYIFLVNECSCKYICWNE
jgi:nucleoside permease NupC